MRSWQAILARARRSDQGFGLVEFIVAFGVVFTMLAGLAYTVASGFQDIGFSRQRQAANGLATQLIEQARGVAYAQIEKGIDTANLSGDPKIVSCSGVFKYKACSGTAPTGEAIVHSSRPDPADPNDPNDPNARVAPLDPHRVDNVQVEQTTLDRAVYVTKATNPSDAYRVIARVTWERSLRGGPQPLVETHTLVFSPDGCRGTVTHPFAAPCQPFLYGTAEAPAGVLKVTGTISTATLPETTVVTPSARADVQDEQVARIVGAATASTLKIGDETRGGESVATTADSDVATNSPGAYQSLSTSPAAASSVSSTTGELTLAQQNNGDSPSSVSAAAATATDTCPTSPSPPNPETDSEPCGRARTSQGGALLADLRLIAGATLLGNANLVRFDTPTGAPVSGFVDRDAGGSAGSVISTAARSLGEIRIGGLPANVTSPPGWQGYFIRLTGYSDSATAAAGTGTSVPATSIGGGTVEYWNGSGYGTRAVGPAVGAVPFTQLTLTTVVGTVPIEITISPAVDGGGAADPNSMQSGGTATEDPDNASTRKLAKATVAPPLVGTLHYVVTSGGTVNPETPRASCGDAQMCLADLELSVNLGTLVANATYQPPPIEGT